MSTRSKTMRRVKRNKKLIVLEKSIAVATPEKPTKNVFFGSKGMHRILYIVVLLTWSWMFYYAPQYIGLHTSWIINLCNFLSLFCIVGIFAMTYPSFLDWLHKADSDSLFVFGTISLTVMAFMLYYLGNISIYPKTGMYIENAKMLRFMCFIASLGSVLGIIYIVPMITYICIYKLRSFIKFFTVKNIATFVLTILTILTAIFQLLQVLLPLFNAK